METISENVRNPRKEKKVISEFSINTKEVTIRVNNKVASSFIQFRKEK